jgi:hypothetical protein
MASMRGARIALRVALRAIDMGASVVGRLLDND